MDVYTFALYIGILTYALILLAFLTGLRLIRVTVKYHKMIAVAAMIAATLHAGFFIYVNFFFKQ